MKTIIRLTLTLLLLQLSIGAFSIDDDIADTLNTPKKVLILAQSNDTRGIFLTVIDLNNNELVILFIGTGDYAYGNISRLRLRKVTRTGIFLDPEQQKNISICDGYIPQKRVIS